MADSFGLAFYKAQDAAPGTPAARGHGADHRRRQGQGRRRSRWPAQFARAGLHASRPPRARRRSWPSTASSPSRSYKMHEGRPNIADAIKNGEIQLVINTPAGKASKADDSYIRKAAIRYKVPYITTMAAALAAAKGIAACRERTGRDQVPAELPRRSRVDSRRCPRSARGPRQTWVRSIAAGR